MNNFKDNVSGIKIKLNGKLSYDFDYSLIKKISA